MDFMKGFSSCIPNRSGSKENFAAIPLVYNLYMKDEERRGDELKAYKESIGRHNTAIMDAIIDRNCLLEKLVNHISENFTFFYNSQVFEDIQGEVYDKRLESPMLRSLVDAVKAVFTSLSDMSLVSADSSIAFNNVLPTYCDYLTLAFSDKPEILLDEGQDGYAKLIYLYLPCLPNIIESVKYEFRKSSVFYDRRQIFSAEMIVSAGLTFPRKNKSADESKTEDFADTVGNVKIAHSYSVTEIDAALAKLIAMDHEEYWNAMKEVLQEESRKMKSHYWEETEEEYMDNFRLEMFSEGAYSPFRYR